MVERASGAPSLPADWPAHPDLSLALNRMGSFDWDLDSGLLYLDQAALDIFDLYADEYDGHPQTLARRVPPDEATSLDAQVSQVLKDGSTTYGTSFRLLGRDGSPRWVHAQAVIRRDAEGTPHRMIGIVRHTVQELGEPSVRVAADIEGSRRTGVVEGTTGALAHARTVKDVINVLQDSRGLKHLGACSLVMGLVEGGHILLVGEGPEDSYVPGTRYTRIDEPYPMSDAVRTLAPRFIESADDFAVCYPDLWQRIDGLGISAAAYLPLIAQGRPIGAIGLLYRDKADFGADERSLLIALGSSVAQSLQRAVLYEQEHDLAQGLQQAMLPRRIPAVPGAQIAVRYRSARIGRDVGGDWYDVIPLPSGRVGAVIGDVQGHDTHAAAVMGQLRIVLRAYAAEGHAPATVMARASDFLHELDTDRFATCLYAEADLATGMLQLVRAGHVDPLMRAPGGSCQRVPVEGGLPLGLSVEFGQRDYPVTTVELDPGHTLLLFTDGLVEQPGADLDDGMQLVTSMVQSGPKDLQLLADQLSGVVHERGGEDDVALLLLRRQGLDVPQNASRLRQHVAQSDPEALGAARRMLRAAVRAWGAQDHADDVELAADELMTNALVHTEGGAAVTIRVLRPHRRLRVEVDDCSSALPRLRKAAGSDISGRGLMLVDQLADDWGVESRGSGKCVWCEFTVLERVAM
jgi:serine phosphatase RsbU (regulator of sigma subunit)/anti-sigma regulatory factor (Ser/Thr protein kinase)